MVENLPAEAGDMGSVPRTLDLLGKLFLAGEEFQQEKDVRWVEAVRLPKGLRTTLDDPQHLEDAPGLGLPQGREPLQHWRQNSSQEHPEHSQARAEEKQTPPRVLKGHISKRKYYCEVSCLLLLVITQQYYISPHCLEAQ